MNYLNTLLPMRKLKVHSVSRLVPCLITRISAASTRYKLRDGAIRNGTPTDDPRQDRVR